MRIIYFNQTPNHCDSVLIILCYHAGLVFVKNRKRQWELTGGGCKAGETLLETATREAYEEAGAVLDLATYEVLGYYVLADGHTTLISQAEVDHFEAIPAASETYQRLKALEPFPADWMSFQASIYTEIFCYLDWGGAHD